MASNIHSKLTGHQLHNPKDWDSAPNGTVFVKGHFGEPKWVGQEFGKEVSITFVADVSGSLHHKYFTLYTEYNQQKLAIYYDVDNQGAMSIPLGYSGVVEVSISLNATASDVRSATSSALTTLQNDTSNHTHVYGSITSASDNITLTTDNANAPSEVNTGFTFSSVTDATISDHDGVLFFETTDRSGDWKTITLTDVFKRREAFESANNNSIPVKGNTGGDEYFRPQNDKIVATRSDGQFEALDKFSVGSHHISVSGYCNKAAAGHYAKQFSGDYHNYNIAVAPNDATDTSDTEKGKWYHMYSEIQMPRAGTITKCRFYYGGTSSINWKLLLYKAPNFADGGSVNTDIDLTLLGNELALNDLVGTTTAKAKTYDLTTGTTTFAEGDVIVLVVKKDDTDSGNKSLWFNGVLEYNFF